jgi:hypothetical protein
MMKPPVETVEIDAPDDGNGGIVGLFVVVNGVRIAERLPDPRTDEMGWISLEPGWAVYSPPGHEHIEITYNDVRVH